jgi:hypothetical protein
MNKGVVFSGYRIPEGLRDFDLAVYLVKGAKSFGEYVEIRNAWEKMNKSNDFESFFSTMSKYGFKSRNDLFLIAFMSDFQFNKFYRIVEKEYEIFRIIREEYKGIVEVLDAMAKRKENSFIIGDVEDVSNDIIRTFFHKRHQNYKNPKRNSTALVVSDINRLSVIGRNDIVLLAINGNRLLKCDHKNEIQTANIIFISEINGGIYLPDWIELKNLVFMADDIVDGTVHVGDYYIKFDY